MSSDDEASTESTGGGDLDWSRRTLLKVGGAGAGAAALGGVTFATADEHEDGEDGKNGDEGGEDAFLADLVDPTFGYPFAADETGDVDVEAVVEMAVEGGPGAHAGFPQDEDGSEVEAEFVFDPVGLQVEPDTLVHFASVSGEHTATAFHEKFGNEQLPIETRVPEAVPGFTSPPVVGGESWVYEFAEKGVYDLLCLPHLFFGMVMRIVVFDPEADDVEDEAFAAPEGDVGLPNVDAVLNAPELEPSNVVEAGEVAWADLSLGEDTGTGTGTETGTGTGTETDTETGTGA